MKRQTNPSGKRVIPKPIRGTFEGVAKRILARSSEQEGLVAWDLDREVLYRRMMAVAATEDRVRPLFHPGEKQYWLQSRWAIMTAAPVFSVEDLDRRLGLTAAAALRLLESLPPEALAAVHPALSQLGQPDPTLVPVCRELRFGSDLLRKGVSLIRQRNSPRYPDRGWYNPRTAAGSTSSSGRGLFPQVWACVPSRRKEEAAAAFEAKLWEYVECLCSCDLLYRHAASEGLLRLKHILDEMEQNPVERVNPRTMQAVSQIRKELENAAAMEDPDWLEGEPEQPASVGFLKRLRLAVSHRNYIADLRQAARELSILLNRDTTFLQTGFLVEPPWDPSEETDLDREVRARISAFTVEDPFEICFGFLCLLEQNSDLPWLYNPAMAVLLAAGRRLPWAEPSADDAPPDLWENFRLEQLVYRQTGALLPFRNLESGQERDSLEKAGASPQTAQDLGMLLQAFRLIGGIRLTPPRPKPALSRKPEEQPTTPEEEQKREARKLLAELQRKAEDQERRNRELREAIQAARQKAAEEEETGQAIARQKEAEQRELEELRSMLAQTMSGQEESREESADSVFPCSIRKRVVVFGGHETWQGLLHNLLPEITIVPADQQPDRDMIRNADTVWIQIRHFAHKYYFPIINTVRIHDIPVRYFSHGGARLCARQILEDEQESPGQD